MNIRKSGLGIGAAILLLAGSAFAAGAGNLDRHGGCREMETMDHGRQTAPESAPGSAFDGAMMHMHQAMSDIKPTGDVDTDFVRGMIPHHQGAIEMARIELAKGHDPQNRKLAGAIIEAQEKEIAAMRQWLARHEAR